MTALRENKVKKLEKRKHFLNITLLNVEESIYVNDEYKFKFLI